MAGFTGWYSVGSTVNPQPIDETSTTLKTKLGTKIRAQHADYGEAEFIYLKGVASTAQVDWVTFDEAYITVRGENDVGDCVVRAMTKATGSPYQDIAERVARENIKPIKKELKIKINQ